MRAQTLGTLRRAALAALLGVGVAGWAQTPAFATGCELLPDHGRLQSALQAIVKQGAAANSGFGNQQWAVVVNRDGLVCAVVFSGPDRHAQWLGSRLIAAEKASTANAFSSPGFALSTGNLFAASQPGQSLDSLTTSAPPNPQAAYAGPPEQFGQPNDPMVGKPIGGVIVFGGGLPLYNAEGKLVGGLGVSGDTSCNDHIVAWKVRHALNLDAVPAGPAKNGNDNLILDIQANGQSASGFGHPTCHGGKAPDDLIKKLPEQFRPMKKK